MIVRQILDRNAGSVLTPELISGIVAALDLAYPDSVFSSVPVRPTEWPVVNDPRLCTDRAMVGDWVAQRTGHFGDWGNHGAIGLYSPDGSRLVAGCVINNITETNAYPHVACVGKHAFKRVFFHAVFDYAFRQLDLERLTATVDEDNTAALRFDEHMGFEREHVIKNGNAGDVIMLVMWRDRCRWLNRGE